jgi:hypothetical protein
MSDETTTAVVPEPATISDPPRFDPLAPRTVPDAGRMFDEIDGHMGQLMTAWQEFQQAFAHVHNGGGRGFQPAELAKLLEHLHAETGEALRRLKGAARTTRCAVLAMEQAKSKVREQALSVNMDHILALPPG